MLKTVRFNLLVLFLAVMTCRPALTKAAEQQSASVDYPFGLVAFASIERLQALSESLAEASGEPRQGISLLEGVASDTALMRFLQAPGLDSTCPVGIMSYPDWYFVPEADPFADPAPIGIDLNPTEYLSGILVEHATRIVCLPIKNQQQLLDGVREIISRQGGHLIPHEGRSRWYRVGEEDNAFVGVVGKYLLLGESDHVDPRAIVRSYPDFGQLARSSLGGKQFVCSLYRRGLPKEMDEEAAQFKMGFAAKFQRQDHESDLEFRLRTMGSETQRQLVDLALSHVDEFRITGDVDKQTSSLIFDAEVVGAKGGKLAKFFNSEKQPSNPFPRLASEASVFWGAVSLPLVTKEWKPVADAIYATADAANPADLSSVLRVVAKTIESGQLDLYTFNPNWNEGLIAIRVAGNPQFPDQVQRCLEQLSKPPLFQLAVDSIDGVPIHRTPTTLQEEPCGTLLGIAVAILMGIEPSIPALNEPSRQMEVEFESIQMVKGDDGKTQAVPRITRHQMISGGQHTLWLAATPGAVWLSYSTRKGKACPEWFKEQIAKSRSKTASADKGLRKGFLQLSLSGVGATPPGSEQPDVMLIDATDEDEEDFRKETLRGDLLRDLPNTIRCEFVPTETGARLTIALEAGYFQCLAAYCKDRADRNAANQAKAAAKQVDGFAPEPAPPVIP